MGTWGPGNFESDNAQDYLDTFLNKLLQDIQDGLDAFYRLPADSFLDLADRTFLPALDIYTTLLIEYDGAPGLELDVFKQWRTLYFDVFDQDDTINPPGFKPGRREAIVELFNKLEAYLLDWYKAG